eukprot:COSAG06_NODE_32386_length_507_cov_0.730392_1_plen_64_part_01
MRSSAAAESPPPSRCCSPSGPDWTVDTISELSLMEQLLLLGLDRQGNLPHNGLLDDTFSKALRA